MSKVRIAFWMPSLLITMMMLTSCGGGGGQAQASSQPDYKTVKTMVLDIMQTEEAKKTVSTMMKDEKFKQSMILDASTVRTTLVQSLANPKNPQIKEAFSDPKFTSTLAKSMKEENKNLLKDLMKDPEYQKMMISVLKDPEFEKNLLDLMKSSAYRQHTMQIMKEALKSPLFQEELLKLMTKATEEMMKPETLKQGGKKKGEGKGDGGGGGGGGGGGSK
ncbi:spore germination lipoprotein GerD [Brevibacillus sp. SYSU BS000544]|uniref:spore germination lipoprotein GerD n=1 Tax=Brevibacillus sp. SYSU BS000544 TaxID=3416443 RepID=UPI003CE46683